MTGSRKCELCGKVLSSRIEREEGVHLACKEQQTDAEEETALLVGGR